MNLRAFRKDGQVFIFDGMKIPATAVLHAMSTAITPIDLANQLEKIVDDITRLRRARRNAREIFVTTRNVGRGWFQPQIRRIRGVSSEPNQYLNIQTMRQAQIWEESKKPLTEEFHYGIEIELTTDCNKAELIRHASTLGLKQYLQVKRDGSIRLLTKKEGFELCICVPESKLTEVMDKVQRLLNLIQAVVNSSCGLHIHLDMRHAGDDRAKQWEAYLNLKMGQNVIKRSVAKSRHTSKWCRWTTATDIHGARNAGSRYRAINGNAMRSHGTIEVRAFQGTTDCLDIVAYCLMLKKILNTKNPLKRASNSQATLTRIYGFDVVHTMRKLEAKYNMAS